MKPEERGIHYYNNLTSKETMNRVNLKKSFSSSFNKEVLRKATTFKIDPEKAAYISESIWETEAISSNEEELFPRKKINIFKFYFHLFEPIDWVFFYFWNDWMCSLWSIKTSYILFKFTNLF